MADTAAVDEVLWYQRKELAKSKISSKGQITLPIEIRERLGVRVGDSIKFIVDTDGRTLVLPVREEKDVFAQFIGVAPIPGYDSAVDWVRDLRDDDYEAEQTRLRREAAKKAPAVAA